MDKVRNQVEQKLIDAVEALESEWVTKSTNIFDVLKVEHKRLDACLSDQIQIQYQWETFLADAEAILEHAKNYSDQCYASAYKQEIHNNKKIVSTTDAKILAENDFNYIDAKKIQNKAFLIKNRIEAVLEAVNVRKYALKNLSDLVIHGSEKHII